jgi:MFS family permease
MRWRYVICGVLVLMIGSYLDNVRGPILPALNQALSLSYGQSSWFLVVGNIAAVLATFGLIFLTPRIGTRRTAILSCAIGLVAAAIPLTVGDFPRLILAAVFLGSAVSAFGAICNVLVIEGTDLAHRSRILCGLHMMYGFGSLAAPAIAGLMLENGRPWASILALAIPVVAAIGLFAIFGIPEEPREANRKPVTGSFSLMQGLVIGIFVLYVAGEVLTSVWMVPYLVEARGMELASAAWHLSGFFLAMGLSRCLCSFSLSPHHETGIVFGAFGAHVAFFSLGRAGNDWALPLTGMVGPFFPVFLSRASRRFPERATHLTLLMLTFVQLSLAVCHWGMGRLTDSIGLVGAYYLPVILMALAACGFAAYLLGERRGWD